MSDEIKAEDQQLSPLREEKKQPTFGSKLSLFISLLSLILILCAIAWGYLSVSKANRSLKSAIKIVKQETNRTQEQMLTLKNTMTENEQTIKAAKDLSLKQTQLVAEWQAAEKGDLAKWQVAEAQYLVKLANDHLQFNHDANMAKILLERANDVLSNVQNTNILEIRKAIASNLANLSGTPQNDATHLFLRVSGLDKTIDQLPFPSNPLKPEPSTSVEEVNNANLPWWKVGLNKAWLGLSQIVIIRKTYSNELPLVLPEEKTFLMQNLHAQMSYISWAILHQNNAVYQASLSNAYNFIQAYFAKDADLTKSVLLNLNELEKINIEPVSLDLSATLKLFDDFFNEAKQGTET